MGIYEKKLKVPQIWPRSKSEICCGLIILLELSDLYYQQGSGTFTSISEKYSIPVSLLKPVADKLTSIGIISTQNEDLCLLEEPQRYWIIEMLSILKQHFNDNIKTI